MAEPAPSMILLAAVDWNRLFSPDVIWVLIPITAITFHFVRIILERQNAHQERMEMIKRGMHPDDPERRASQAANLPRDLS